MKTTLYIALAAGVIFAAATAENMRAQRPNTNFVRRTVYTQTDTSKWKRQETVLFDGLGRSVHSVRFQASPEGGDLWNMTEYDSLGREHRVWQDVPFGSTTAWSVTSSMFRDSAQVAWSDAYPYSETVYDGSPLDRVSKVIGPGQAWHVADKSVRQNYLTGNPGMDSMRVACYAVIHVSNMIIVQRLRYGNAGEHICTRVQDEDGRETLEFKDMDGNIIQTVQKLSDSSRLVTSYIYDAAGRLVGVLPPMLTSALTRENEQSPSWNSVYYPSILEFGYFYRYDDRGHLIAKKLPGIGWTYYVYDKGDRLVLSQDPVQRNDGKWAFRLQDRLGRECLTGLCTNTMDAFANPLGDANVVAGRNDSSGAYYCYDVEGLTLLNAEVLTVNWWDDYGFLGTNGVPSAQSSATAYESPESGFGTLYSDSALGLCTGTLTKVLDGASPSTYLWSVVYYDDKGRPVQRKQLTHLGGIEKEYLGYDFVGQLKKWKQVHVDANDGSLSERYEYDYDGWGRPTEVTHQLGNNSIVTLKECTYDNLGRMIRDQRNGTALLDTRYGYNVRGWLTSLRVGRNPSSGSLGENYLQDNYYNVGRTANSFTQWAGNISGMSWKASGENVTHSYDFTYDGLSRLTGAASAPTSGQNRNYTYDKNGNILTVSGVGAPSVFTYTGNQLTSDSTGGSPHQHGYDANGRLSSSGGWSYYYNAIGLPWAKVYSSSVTTWTYSADGTKLSRKTQIASAPRMDYVSNLVYKDGVLNRVLIDGGYVDMTGIAPAYCFYVNDHEGNVRLVTDASGTPLQVNHYDPFGNELDMSASSSPVGSSPVLAGTATVNLYKYGGKEWDEKMTLYDFSARMYDPALHRFTTMDPLAEKDYSISPYAYCAGNPVNLVDPDGMEWYLCTNAENKTEYVYSEGEMSEEEKNKYQNVEKHKKLFFLDPNTNIYYSLFGQRIPWITQDGHPTQARFTNVVDRLIYTFFANKEDEATGAFNKVPIYIDDLPAGKIFKSDKFFYGGKTFSTLRGQDLPGSDSFSHSCYWNSKDCRAAIYKLSNLPIEATVNANFLKPEATYWLRAGDSTTGISLKGDLGFTYVQLEFDGPNANAFLKSCVNLFPDSPDARIIKTMLK